MKKFCPGQKNFCPGQTTHLAWSKKILPWSNGKFRQANSRLTTAPLFGGQLRLKFMQFGV
jgi:hypothetical protein